LFLSWNCCAVSPCSVTFNLPLWGLFIMSSKDIRSFFTSPKRTSPPKKTASDTPQKTESKTGNLSDDDVEIVKPQKKEVSRGRERQEKERRDS